MYLYSLLLLLVAACIDIVVAKSGPLTAAYIEVNSNSIDNTAQYQLSDGSNVFDIAIIFASNIRYNGTDRTWYNNENVQAILDNANCEIKPLQDRGIKVLLSLLGAEKGRGLANFVSKDEAAAFAKVAADQILSYGLDGIDLDDEYVNYGSDGSPPPNANSFGWFLQALRKELPSKLITMYNIGPAAESLTGTDPSIGGILDYAWNPYYGSFNPPQISGLDKPRIAAAAIAVENTDTQQAQDLAQETLDQGYGAYLTYNLANGDQSTYVDAFAKVLYGLDTKFVPFEAAACCVATS